MDWYCHFDRTTGWIETKNQYNCPTCSLYFTQIQRKFLFCTSGYYVLNVTPTDKKKINPNSKYRKPRNIPLYYIPKEEIYNSWDKYDTIEWDGKCVVRKGEIFNLDEDFYACCTGKSSLFGDFICPSCNLLHHAEERHA